MQHPPARLWRPLLCLGLPLCTMGAEVSGVLRDNQGNGLTGITITADLHGTASDTQLVATTDAAGHFSFSGDDGYWGIDVSAAQLNALGYFSVSVPIQTVTNHSTLRLTTRKLDFTHRMVGRVLDENGDGLAGYTLRARISENAGQFETNVVMDASGSFAFAAVPAVWNLYLDSPAGWPEPVFAEQLIEVELTNAVKQAGTFVAPAAMSTISVTVSQAGFWDVVASAQGFGTNYTLVRPAYSSSFGVFNGVWTISATNRYFSQASLTPVTVAVTNSIVSVVLTNSPDLGPTQQVQRVRTVTSSGMVVSNADLFATVPDGSVFNSLPPNPFGTPGVYDLNLTAGRWRLNATAVYPDLIDWSVRREVTIQSNVAPPEVTLVFPEPDAGPRIFGTVRTPAGIGVPAAFVSFYMTDDGTNYAAQGLVTDASGQFDCHVIPGQWLVEVAGVNCSPSSVVAISDQDMQVDLEVFLPDNGPPVNVNVKAVYEDGTPLLDGWFDLQSGSEYFATNGPPNFDCLLRPGIWHPSMQQSSYVNNDGYTLFPSFTWQLSPGPATNLLFVARQTPARIEGRLRDEQGRLLLSGNAAAWTSVNGTNFWSYGAIESGYFSLNVFPGDWQVGVSVSSYPSVGTTSGNIPPGGRGPNTPQPTNYYTTPPLRWVRVSNDVVRCEFVTTNISLPPTVNVTVTSVQEDGASLRDVEISVSSQTGGQRYSTGEGGTASFWVVPDRLTTVAWGFEIRAYGPPDPASLLWPTLSLDITAPSNQVVLIVRQPTACIGGTILNASPLGMLLSVYATAVINGTNYSISACPDVAGHYCLPAIPGLWTIQIADGWLNDFGFQSVAPKTVIVPTTGQPPPADFDLARFVVDYREARLTKPVMLANGALQLELDGHASLSWRVELSHNLIDWTPFALTTSVNGRSVIEAPATDSDQATFYRAVWVR